MYNRLLGYRLVDYPRIGFHQVQDFNTNHLNN
jgi:hypothetical protein